MITAETRRRTPFAKFVRTLTRLHVALSLCGVMAACGGTEAQDGIVASYHTAALQIGRGPPTTGTCIDCGCKYEHAEKNEAGCDVYSCVCATESKAQCVVDGGTKPKSRASQISLPGTFSQPASTAGPKTPPRARPAAARPGTTWAQ